MLPLEDAIDGAGWQRIYIDLPWAEGNGDIHAASADQVAQGLWTTSTNTSEIDRSR